MKKKRLVASSSASSSFRFFLLPPMRGLHIHSRTRFSAVDLPIDGKLHMDMSFQPSTAPPALEHSDASAIGACIFSQLPHDLQLRVLSKLADELPALQSFCFASRKFAESFRKPYLWQLLTEERWGAASMQPCPGEGLVARQERFAMWAGADFLNTQLYAQQEAELQELELTFKNLAPGTYQVFIHKRWHPNIPVSTVTTSISGLGIDESIQGTYYEALYPASTSIATAAFTVCSACNVLFSCSHMPAGLRSVQLKKLEQGHRLKISPQWQVVTVRGTYPAKEETAVGSEENGDALWLSLRLRDYHNMRPELGKIRPDLAFHYAEIGSGKEQLFHQPFYVATNALSALHPGVLVNARDFIWVSTDLKHVHTILQIAVPLAVHQQGHGKSKTLYGARVRFCGWSQARSRRDSSKMMTSGRLISLLPGKLEVEAFDSSRRSAAAIFTWGGKTTSRSGLEGNQAFELLCFKHFGAM